MKNIDKEEAIDLMRRTNRRIPKGLMKSEIESAELRIDMRFPDSLREWLMITNGPDIGPGGILGLSDIEEVLNGNYGWKPQKWIPVASDGCGNYHVIVHENDDMDSVAFIDCAADFKNIAYIVASNLWTFLRCYFEKQLIDTEWPFVKSEVLMRDPDILKSKLPVPWEDDL